MGDTGIYAVIGEAGIALFCALPWAKVCQHNHIEEKGYPAPIEVF